MRTMRIFFVAVMLVTFLFGHSQPASAGSATHYSVRVNNVTIPWFFPPPEGLSSLCPRIPEGVHINPDDLGSNRVKNVIVFQAREQPPAQPSEHAPPPTLPRNAPRLIPQASNCTCFHTQFGLPDR